jgi:transposase
VAGSPAGDQRDLVAVQDRRAVAGSARTLWAVEDRPRAAAQVDRRWHLGADPGRGGGQGRLHRCRGVDLQRGLQLGPGAPARRWSPEKGGCATGWVEDLAIDGEALGRSRGGLTTKLHLAVDGRGLPMAVLLTPGQAGDNPQLLPLLDDISVARPGPGRPRQRPDRVIADTAYAHPSTRAALRARGIALISPERSNQIARRKAKGGAGGRPLAVDRTVYADRNVVARCFAPLRQFRGLATHYAKRAVLPGHPDHCCNRSVVP